MKSNPFISLSSCSIAILGALATALVLPAQSASQARIRTGSGVVSGRVEHNVLVYKGIPFAQPPVGELRWRPPQAMKPWRGVRSATAWGHICMQEVKVDPGIGTEEPSEDCLTLNVFAPPSTQAPHAVMVFFHGGGSPKGPQAQHFLTVLTWPSRDLSSSHATTASGDSGFSLIQL